jgi:LytS/YehU family sensor histidine kinase
MVMSLSNFMRTTLSLDPLHDVPLADELALQEEYLAIERERFCDRMSFRFEMAEEARHALVPSLILQPLIENAIKHGVGGATGPVDITLSAAREGERLRISVENGMAADAAPERRQPGMGLGLRNVAERLRLRFQDGGRFSCGPVGADRYRAVIDLPWRCA